MKNTQIHLFFGSVCVALAAYILFNQRNEQQGESALKRTLICQNASFDTYYRMQRAAYEVVLEAGTQYVTDSSIKALAASDCLKSILDSLQTVFKSPIAYTTETRFQRLATLRDSLTKHTVPKLPLQLTDEDLFPERSKFEHCSDITERAYFNAACLKLAKATYELQRFHEIRTGGCNSDCFPHQIGMSLNLLNPHPGDTIHAAVYLSSPASLWNDVPGAIQLDNNVFTKFKEGIVRTSVSFPHRGLNRLVLTGRMEDLLGDTFPVEARTYFFNVK